jgi:uncharacterized protein (TIGR02996 family)
MNPDPGILGAIYDDSDDVEIRRVFADWLEDQGDPRAEFVRIQCDLQATGEFDLRQPLLRECEAALLNRHGNEWVAPLGPAASYVHFRGGLIEGVSCRTEDFVGQAKEWRDCIPLRRLALTDAQDHIGRLAGCPELEQVIELNFQDSRLGKADIGELLASPYLKNLRTLNLNRNPVGDEVFRALSSSTSQGTLRELHLNRAGCSANGIEWLASRSALPHMELLDLTDNGIGDAGVHFLAATRQLPTLRDLRLGGNRIGDSSLRVFARAFPQLRRLALERNAFGGEAVEALGRQADALPLETLDLSTSRLGRGAIQALATAPRFASLKTLILNGVDLGPSLLPVLLNGISPTLEHLALGGNPLGREGCEILARTARLSNLRRLSLNQQNLGDAWGVKAIVWSPVLVHLQCLELAHNRLDDQCLLTMSACPVRPHLARLNLRHNQLTDEALEHLGEWPNWPALRELDFGQNEIGDAGLARLAAAPLLSRLVRLGLAETSVTSAGVQMLLQSPRAKRLQRLDLAKIPLDPPTTETLDSRFFSKISPTDWWQS